MKITTIQRHFIRTACNLKDEVYDFTQTDEDFIEVYGFNKEVAEKEIENLLNKTYGK